MNFVAIYLPIYDAVLWLCTLVPFICLFLLSDNMMVHYFATILYDSSTCQAKRSANIMYLY